MATLRVAVQPLNSPTDAATLPINIILSPDRNRKQRTPDRDINEPFRSYCFSYYSGSPADLSPEIRRASAHSSHSACGAADDSATSSRERDSSGVFCPNNFSLMVSARKTFHSYKSQYLCYRHCGSVSASYRKNAYRIRRRCRRL